MKKDIKWQVQTAVGIAGTFTIRKAARELVSAIKASGSAPAAIRIVKVAQ